MSASTSGIGRMLARLLESFACTVGPDWVVHQSLFGCTVVAASSVPPRPADHQDRSPVPELFWHRRDGRWQLDGCVLPAALTEASAQRRSPEEPDARR